MKRISRQLPLFLILLALTNVACAWTRSLEVGYGYSHDPNHSKYYNSGFFLNSDLVPVWRNNWSYWTLNGSVGKWTTTTPINKNLVTVAATLAVRLYPFNCKPEWMTYFLGSAGPAYMSSRNYGYNNQGKNMSGQWTIGVGMEHHQYDINLRLVHFSNAHLSSPDQGFNIQYTLSVGYLFL